MTAACARSGAREAAGDVPAAGSLRGLARRFLAGSILIVAAAAAATALTLMLAVDDIAARLGCGETVECREIAAEIDTSPPGEPRTVMVVGTDHRLSDQAEDVERSDTLMLVRLDPDDGVVRVISVPRDLEVEIPGRGLDKINQAFAIGGASLTARAVKSALGIRINHVVQVDFRGFKDVVNALGCAWIDVDRRYFHSNDGLPQSEHFDEIDIEPGYQRLCDEKALDFARFRHTDDDFRRGARQQEVVRELRSQVDMGTLLTERERLIDVFTGATKSDIDGRRELMDLLRLIRASSDRPFRQIRWEGTAVPGGDTVVSTPDEIKEMVDEFLGRDGGRRGASGGGASGAGAAADDGADAGRADAQADGRGGRPEEIDLEDASDAGRRAAVRAAPRAEFAVVYPKLVPVGSKYDSDPTSENPRTYRLTADGGERHRAVKMVMALGNGVGYWGVMQTTWLDPPALRAPSEVRTVGGRRLELFFDGKDLRMVAWRTSEAAYWISNTLANELTERQMVSIAASLKPVEPVAR